MQPYYDDKWHSPENDKVKDEDIKKALNEFTPIFYQNKWTKFHNHLQSIKNSSSSSGFINELNELAKEKDRINYTTLEPYINSYDKKIMSNLNREYPYVYGLKDNSKLKDNNPFKQPNLYTYRKTGGKIKVDNPAKVSAPYAHVNLWSRRQLNMDELYKLGIVETIEGKTVINLRGIIEIADNERLIIGDIDGKGIKPADGDNTVYYRGSGVIIATNIYINKKICPYDKELYEGTPNICILSTKGNPIIVDTEEELQVSLISMVTAANANKIGNNGLNGMILATKKLNLYGSLAADWLGISLPFKSTIAWADGKHRITYDPKLHPDHDIYQVNISRWTSFERILEQED